MNRLLPADTKMVFLVLCIVSLIVVFMILGIRGTSGGKKVVLHKKKKRPSMNTLLVLVLLSLALVLMFISVYFYYYTPLKGEMLVARLEFQKSSGSNSDFQLFIIPFENEKRLDSRSYALKGTAWSLQGEVLKWTPFAEKVGLRTMFRLTGITGYDSKGGVEKKGHAIELTSSSRQALYAMVDRVNNIFKLARIVPCRSERAEPVWSGGYDVYANSNGLRIKRVSALPGKAEHEKTPQKERRYPRRPEDVRH